MDFRGSAKRLLGLFRPHRWAVAGILALASASTALFVLGPKVLGRATDLIFSGVIGGRLDPRIPKDQVVAAMRSSGEDKLADMLAAMDVVPGQGIDFGKVGTVLAWVVGIYLGAALLGYLQGLVTATVVQRTVFTLRQSIEDKLSRLPLRYFDGQPRGEVLSRVTNDIDNVAQSLQQTFSQIIGSLLTVVGVLAMMFWISPLLALIALFTVPVSAVVVGVIGKRAQPQFIKQWATTGELNGHIEEAFTGHSLVKVFGRQHESAATFAKHNDELFESSFRAHFISGIIQPAMMFIGNLNYVLVAVVGGLRVASGAISLGDVQAFIQYTRQFTQPLAQLASMANLLQSGVASAERVFEFLDAEEQEPESPTPSRLDERLRGRVAFEEVSFRYTPDKPLIERLDLTVEPGETVAIVGPTGAGKTTLVNLLMRFYEVTGGRITLDGVDIRAMTRDDVRDAMGMVLWDTWLFGGTIAENIAYGAGREVPRGDRRAAKATHVDHFVRLPDGYETVIDDEGANLSAGEKQLITIARAFLSEPVILILDEATSSVDTRTEVLIQRAMASLRAGRTSFVIAHRLSTIRDADTILVMESGSIVEHGNHDELLASGGAYAKLYEAQFAQAVEVG
jgi:ATP-binding cassette subfamily B protein